MIYSLLKLLQKNLIMLPKPISYALGSFLGFCFFLNQKKRWIAFRNLKAAFPEKTNKEISLLIKSSFNNLGLSIIENIAAPIFLDTVEINGLEKLNKNGAVIVGIHEGNWELANSALAKKFDYAILVKKQKNTAVDKFLNETRQSANLKVCFSLKELIKQIHKNGYIGLMADHGAEENALFIDFLSHSVPTPGGAAYLAKKFKKDIFPAYVYRTKNFTHQIEIADPIATQDKSEEELLTIINNFFGNLLIKKPEQYLWSFKRFKHKQNREIIILSDQKNGHLKQSQALLALIKDTLPNHLIHSQTIEITYRNQLCRIIAEIFAWLLPVNSYIFSWLIKLLLKNDSAKKLCGTYADIVISTGNYVAPLNRIYSNYLGAKSITILKPNMPVNKFDLCIIPAHDRLQADNIVLVQGALSYPQDVLAKAKQCQTTFKFTADKKIALFIGGPLRDEKEFLRNLGNFATEFKNFARANNYKILISTSRRTPRLIEEYLEQEFAKFELTECFVCANKKNYDFIFEGFVGSSEAVFVSSESISMITETLSLDKPCVGVILETHGDKHNVFIQAISSEITVLKTPFATSEIKFKVTDVFRQNKQAVQTALTKII